MKRILNYSNGALVAPVKDSYLKVYNPATGSVYGEAPDSDEEDMQLAIDAAQEAFPIWSSLSSDKRHEYLTAIAQKIWVCLKAC